MAVISVFFLLTCILAAVWPYPILESLADLDQDMALRVERRGGQRFCGPNLTGALALVCSGNYNSPKEKRWPAAYLKYGARQRWTSTPFNQEGSEENETGSSYEFDASRFKHAYKRGVVDECCKKSCTLSTLQLYCAEKNNG